MQLYQDAFGSNYNLGISIPEYFVDQSYKNDAGPSFIYQKNNRLLKVCVLPERPEERDIEGGLRYTLMEMESVPGDDYQEFVDILFECESAEEFENVIFNQAQLDQWLA